jgi:DNA (cytosine-5)-methyltransferase 1
MKENLNELALFAGAGGGILGGHLLGWRTVCAVEWEPYPASVLAARQNDGLLPPFPIWDDVQTFDGKPWRGIVDVVSGGFPCQDISAAGKGAGIDGERSGMWGEMARIIHEVRPRFVFVENSPMLTSRGLGRVLGDLASMGFDAKWGVLGAADVGANHQRDRIWIVAKWRGQFSHTQHNRIRRWEQQQEGAKKATNISDSCIDRCWNGKIQYISGQLKSAPNTCNDGEEEHLAHSHSAHGKGNQCAERTQEEYSKSDSSSQLAYPKGIGLQGSNKCGSYEQGSSKGIQSEFARSYGSVSRWWQTEPNVGRVADGVASRVDRLKAIGNGQVPLCAATAWNILSKK